MSPSITPTQLDPVSEWRAWQTLIIIYTMLVNHQIRRRWLLEQKCMQNRPLRERFLPVLLLEPIPTLRRPYVHLINKEATNNPTNETIMDKLRTRVALLRARVEKGKRTRFRDRASYGPASAHSLSDAFLSYLR
ncbi:hypothetical protein N7455_004240 [Penicillium solitum]|uniref:uncharacterized protein n=1 Tax=Penicillium solitum TaxID=60172 RepID=UPI0032C49C91|nr:hypothetical protein N7455_004240 [Penicillium solitum]